MIAHLLTNASVMLGVRTFQRNVYLIHSLGSAVVVLEWLFIFLPILFHAIYGLMIFGSGLPNVTNYGYTNNWRYTLQRLSGLVAFAFIMGHVWHMHGWFHFKQWLAVAESLGGHQFRPYNATSTLAESMSGIMPILYFIGVAGCVFHLANGIWTMGITWGLWTTPEAQQRANLPCTIIGVGLMLVATTALIGAALVDVDKAKEIEDEMYQQGKKAGLVEPNEEKRTHTEE